MDISLLPISSTLVPLESSILQQMIQFSEAFFAVANTEKYRRALRDLHSHSDFSWPFLQDVASPLKGEISSFDFHINPQGAPKLIEFSFFPPPVGMIHLLIEKNNFFSPEDYKKRFFHIFSPYSTIAIIDRDLESQVFISELKYIQKVLEEDHGKTILLAEPDELSEQDGELLLRGEKIDFVFNRLPFADVEAFPEKFLEYALLQQKFPEKFCTPYREWCFSEKSAFLLFSDKQNIFESSLDTDIFPHTSLLSDFSSLEQLKTVFPSNKELILKPLSSYGGRGVLFGASWARLERAIEEKSARKILVQEYIPAPKLPNGQKYDLRLILFEGKAAAIVARVYSGAITNFREPGSGLAQVQVL